MPSGRLPHELCGRGNPCRQRVDCAGDGGSLGGRGGARERARPGDPAEGRPGRGCLRVRLYPSRQPAVAGAPDRELPDGGRCRAHPDPVRVLRPRRPGPAPEHPEPAAKDAEPGARGAGGGADDVRRAHPPVGRGGGRGEEEFRRPGVPVGHPAKCPAVRGTDLRAADNLVCAREPRGGGLHGAGERGDRNWRDAGGSGR